MKGAFRVNMLTAIIKSNQVLIGPFPSKVVKRNAFKNFTRLVK